MLETIICLGIGAGCVHLANKIKQARFAKRALISSNNEVQKTFPDHKDRDVYKMTLLLRPDEVALLDGAVGDFLSPRMITDKQAAAILVNRKEKEE